MRGRCYCVQERDQFDEATEGLAVAAGDHKLAGTSAQPLPC
jgi:hypothetical protein